MRPAPTAARCIVLLALDIAARKVRPSVLPLSASTFRFAHVTRGFTLIYIYIYKYNSNSPAASDILVPYHMSFLNFGAMLFLLSLLSRYPCHMHRHWICFPLKHPYSKACGLHSRNGITTSAIATLTHNDEAYMHIDFVMWISIVCYYIW